jgi:hypothetical protein
MQGKVFFEADKVVGTTIGNLIVLIGYTPLAWPAKQFLDKNNISIKWPPYSLSIVQSDICVPNTKAFLEKDVSAVI